MRNVHRILGVGGGSIVHRGCREKSSQALDKLPVSEMLYSGFDRFSLPELRLQSIKPCGMTKMWTLLFHIVCSSIRPTLNVTLLD